MADFGRAYIQIQDITGDWKNVVNVIKQDQVIARNIDAVSQQMKKLTRAVDEHGNILQLGGARHVR
jgi:hypothetical protein